MPNGDLSDRHVNAALLKLNAQNDLIVVIRAGRPRARQRLPTILWRCVFECVVTRVEILGDGFLIPKVWIGIAKLPDDFVEPHEAKPRRELVARKLAPRKPLNRFSLAIFIGGGRHVALAVATKPFMGRNSPIHVCYLNSPLN